MRLSCAGVPYRWRVLGRERLRQHPRIRRHQTPLPVSARRGLIDITEPVCRALRDSGLTTGICTLYLRHTSASLVIQENADPKVQRDLENFLSRMVPDGDAS